LFKAPFMLIKALLQARTVVRELKPVCVVGFGGYVTGPGGLAAKLAGVPLIIHEQNAVAGTANRSLASFAARVCEAFPQTFAASAKRRTTGNPVRAELFFETPRQALAGRKPRLLVLGGSLGAEPLNKLLPEALAQVPAELRPEVFHQAGKKHDEITLERYRAVGVEAQVAPFIKDMAQAYGWADLVVCRAGALTISELAAAGLPSLLVPLPHAIDDHQSRNADYLAREGAAFVMPQRTTGAAEMAARLTEVLMQPEQLKRMATTARQLAKPDATNTVVDVCLEVAHG
jgi:UDP-N-acetylglucosamine--N-acetylmuramyl-(pentapeptide) pyrophosphoryl-undecaprenol N-acetylglucosamine transferase